MGRPLAKKYFGKLNTDVSGNVSTLTGLNSSDSELGGQAVASLAVGTAGTYTSAGLATLTFPSPLLSVEGAVTATGTPTYTAVSATVSGSQGGIYAVGQLLTVTTAGGTCTFRVASLSTNAVATVDLGTGASAGSFTSLAAGAQTTTVNTGTGTGALLTITYGLASAVTFTTPGFAGDGYLPATVGTAVITATTTAATATSITSTTTGGILSVSAVTGTIANGMIMSGGTLTAGSYIVSQLTSTASAVVSPTFSTTATDGQVGTRTATLSAGTSIATGQLVSGTGLPAGTTVVSVSGATVTFSSNFTTQATGTYNFYAYGGTGTYQLGYNLATGVSATNTQIAALTGTATTGTLNAITVNQTVDMLPGMTFTPATTVGGLTGSTTYYIMTVQGPTTLQVTSSVGGTAGVSLTTTTSQSVNAPFGQNTTVTVGGSGSGAATIVLASSSGQIYNKGANFSTSIQATAFLATTDGGQQPRQLTDIVSQKGARRYRVENQDGIGMVNLTDVTPIGPGTMTIQATDSAGGTYYVTKLLKNKATLTQRSGSQFATGTQVQWVLGAPTLNTTVKIDNQ